jgi:hypothetical protein
LTEHGRFFPLAIDGATPIDPTATYTKSLINCRTIQPTSSLCRAQPPSERFSLQCLPYSAGLACSRYVPRGHRAHNDATKTKGGAALRANVGGDNLDIRFHPFFG